MCLGVYGLSRGGTAPQGFTRLDERQIVGFLHTALLSVALAHGENLPTERPLSRDDFLLFTNQEEACRNYQFATARLQYLKCRLFVSYDEIYDQQQREMVWQLLWYAYVHDWKGSHTYGCSLRKILGYEAYYSGIMPAAVPWWTFEIRP